MLPTSHSRGLRNVLRGSFVDLSLAGKGRKPRLILGVTEETSVQSWVYSDMF